MLTEQIDCIITNQIESMLLIKESKVTFYAFFMIVLT